MMRWLFYVLCLVGVWYYATQKRSFDFFALAFGSAMIYFLPGFSGLVLNPYDTDQTMPLYDLCYTVYCLVLVSNIAGAYCYDHYIEIYDWGRREKPTPSYYCLVAFAIALVGISMSLLKHGDWYWHRNEISKGDLQAMLNAEADRWSVCWEMGALLLAITAFIERKPWYSCMAWGLLGLDLWLGGNRSTAVFALIAMFCVRLGNTPRQLGRYFFSRKYYGKIILTTLVALLFFVSKLLLPLLQAHRMDLFEEIYPSWEDVLFHTFVTGEPAGIQANLSETLRQQISTDFYHPIDLAAQLSVGGDWLGMDSKSHYLDQRILFPDLSYGLAYNIWGDVWASSGWVGLCVFVVVYHGILGLGCLLLRCTRGFGLGVTVLFFSIWAFYIHRNNLLFQLYLQKRIVLFALAVWAIATCLKALHQAVEWK